MKQILIGLSVLALLPWPSSAQEKPQPSEISRTEYGHPDLQGVWYFGSATPFERPDKLADKAVYSAAEVQEMEAQLRQGDEMRSRPLDADRPAPKEGAVIGIEAEYDYMVSNLGLVPVNGEYRTSLVIDPPDGKIPLRDDWQDYYTRLYDSGVARYDRAEALGSSERCLVYALAVPSMFPMPWNPHLQIVQTRDYVVLHTEMIHDARIVRLDKAHFDHGHATWMGDSVGYWEGDTLVVKTENFRPEQSSTMLVMSAEFSLTEWFTLSGDDEITYRYRVEDSETYTSPFTVERVISRVAPDQRIYEFACHEGNYSLPYSLIGARHDEINAERALDLDQVINDHLNEELIERLAGHWSGRANGFTVHLRFLAGNRGGLHAFFDSPASGVSSLILADIEVEGTSFSFSVPAIAASFAGSFADGAIAGDWTREGTTSTLRLTLREQ